MFKLHPKCPDPRRPPVDSLVGGPRPLCLCPCFLKQSGARPACAELPKENCWAGFPSLLAPQPFGSTPESLHPSAGEGTSSTLEHTARERGSLQCRCNWSNWVSRASCSLLLMFTPLWDCRSESLQVFPLLTLPEEWVPPAPTHEVPFTPSNLTTLDIFIVRSSARLETGRVPDAASGAAGDGPG